MQLKTSDYEIIRGLDVNEHKVTCDFSRWEKAFKDSEELQERLRTVRNELGEKFGRDDIVRFYKSKEIELDTKFLSAMIWGYEAPAGSRRDHRGPSRVKIMMESKARKDVLSNVEISNDTAIHKSFREMDKNINKCGSSFLTKHLYFLGKAIKGKEYPLIFDDRVALGSVKYSLGSETCLNFVSVHALRKGKAYIKYLEYAREQAKLIRCELDHIEYFLFVIGGSGA